MIVTVYVPLSANRTEVMSDLSAIGEQQAAHPQVYSPFMQPRKSLCLQARLDLLLTNMENRNPSET